MSLAAAGAKQVTRRFYLVSWIPYALLFLLVFGLVWANGTTQKCHDPPCLDRAVDIATASYGIRIALLILAAFVASLVLHPLQLGLIQLLEGYWDRWTVGRTLAGWLVRRQAARRRRLVHAARIDPRSGTDVDHQQLRVARLAASRLDAYPAPDSLLPTTLGNVLRAAEDNAGRRYELDAVLVWPRLYTVLPERPLGILNDQRMDLDVAAQFCISLLLGSVLSFWLLLSDGVWMLLPLALLTFAWLSYRAAVAVAREYGTMMATVVDLYRFDLLRALHLPLPSNRIEERKRNADLCRVLKAGDLQFQIHGAYTHEPANKVGDADAGGDPSDSGTSS
jgi:hypothetical protein